MMMVLLGEPISAKEALGAGLVAQICQDGGALDAARELASRIAARAPLAMQQAKAMVRASFETQQAAHLTLERQAFAALFGTTDKQEGVTAFLEKRSAVWTGA